VNSLALLVRNPVIVLPGIIVGAVAAGAEFAVVTLALPDWLLLGAIYLVALLLALVQMAYVTGMAGAAWVHGRTQLRDGWDALTHRGVAAAGAGALLLLIGFCAAVLAPATLFVTVLAYAVFFIYTMAAVVIGGKAPIAGIVESAATALRNPLPTIGIVLLIAVIAALGGWLGTLAGRLSDVAGALVAGLLQQVIVAYASLVVAGEYLKLTKAPTMS